MAKKDNRGDNAVHLKNSIRNTEARLHESQEYLDEHADEISATEQAALEAKNERRRQSVRGFKSELQDEAKFDTTE
ncbi:MULTISPECIES: small acid-soluble spore protein Tlp [Paenibacillus]|uniref:small acid-soluble spore protein Tlp n=1 Tax=Paenibacillus TaxID=44249 RepID=UPI00020D6803|nr:MULTISPECIES: small acid-soluble spore protein Tlp [Paenibacillus]EGL19198.1 small, acid-soluble spore protein tlp [Paenibacillus sp. HGF7]EPD81038.1 small, acid-soluble spore protein tlp [Paenibacillus sp. HGH0039]MBV6714926.1 small acid-soluble spore protein Tlp [Paenibacillus chitinolyticus]